MNDSQGVWLAIMAVSLAVMALIQVGLILIAILLARRAATAVEDVRREIKPLLEKVHRIADDAQKATSLAALQVERVDQMMSTTAIRLEEAVTILRNAMGGPVRQGAAAFMAIRAIVAAIRQWRQPDRQGRDEEDPLFVG